MTAFTWWPVVLILLIAPFATYGWGQLERQSLRAAHSRQLDAWRTAADEQVKAAYAGGRRHGAAEVRASERAELEKTRQAMADLQADLDKANDAATPPPTPAELLALCRRSASCRERGALK